MTHPTRTHSDSVWVNGYISVGADFASIDAKTFAAVNGDGGGTWLPGAQIYINGAGVICAAPWVLSGGQSTLTGRITFNQGTTDDYFRFAVSHPETSIISANALLEVEAELPDQSRVQCPADFAGAPTVTTTGIFTLVVGTRVASPLRVRGGGTIETVEFDFLVGNAHASLPQVLPRFRVCAVDSEGNVLPLRAVDSTTDADGFVQLPTPASGAAYYNGGAVQSFTYTCNQHQIVDTSLYSYWIEIIEESGTNSLAGNTYSGVSTSIDNITLLDGRA
jgi:hypothetical protein